MDMQNVSNLQISEGAVRTIHDKDNRLIWGRLAYDTKYVGNSEQRNLPKGYTQVLGIRAGIGSCFDIATTIGTSDSFEYSYSISTATAALHWGYRGTTAYSSANSFNGTFTGEGKLVVFANSSSANTNTKTTEPLDSDTRLDFKYDGDTKTASIPGYTFTKPSGFAPDIEPPQNHFVLNGVYITSNNSYVASAAGNIIYRFKSAECDIYPCVRDSDGTVGLYDVKRNIFIPPTAGTFTVVTGDVVPTPDTPIPVQVVTGEQTITISDGIDSEDFNVSLGSLELCKIGDYQDYIYKSGGSWYIHRENSVNTPNLSESQVRDYVNASYCTFRKPTDYSEYGTYLYDGHMLCSHAVVGTSPSGGWNNSNGIGKAWLGAEKTNVWVGFAPGTTLDDMKAALSGVKMYYPVKTPTNIEITNAGLISQLNSVDQFLTRIPYNYSVSGDLPTEIARAGI